MGMGRQDSDACRLFGVVVLRRLFPIKGHGSILHGDLSLVDSFCTKIHQIQVWYLGLVLGCFCDLRARSIPVVNSRKQPLPRHVLR